MPGKSQLEKFSSDLLAIGNEVTLRAERGERPVKVEIPKDIKDENDRDEFVFGLPEIEKEETPTEIEDDFSDLTGLVNPDSGDGESDAPAPDFSAPDMSGLLDTFETPDIAGDGMPDLSMFNDEPAQEEVIPEAEPEPEEISIADMGLDALLSGGGFDEPEVSDDVAGVEPQIESLEEPELEPSLIDDLNDYDDLEELTDDDLLVESANKDNVDSTNPSDDIFDFDSLGIPAADTTDNEAEANNPFNFDNQNKNAFPFDIPETPVETPPTAVEEPQIDNLEDLDDNIEELEELDDAEELGPIDDLGDIPDIEEVTESTTEEPTIEEEPTDLGGIEDFNLDGLDIPVEDVSGEFDKPLKAPKAEDASNLDDLENIGDIEELDDLPSLDDLAGGDIEDLASADEVPLEPSDDDLFKNPLTEDSTSDLGGVEDFNLDGLDIPVEDVTTEESTTPLNTTTNDDLDNGIDDIPDLEDVGDETNFDIPDLDDLETEAKSSDGETTPSGFSVDDFNLPEDNTDLGSTPAFDDLNLDDLPDIDEVSNDDFSSSTPEGLFDANDVEFDAKDEIPEFDEFGIDESSSEEEPGNDSIEELETFDVPEMEGIDFDIPDTDTQLQGDDDSAFDVPKDDFGFDEKFEIPGFSDVETVKEQKSTTPILKTDAKGKKGKAKLEEEEDELPPNTLSDKQYKIFRKNFSEYPLNVRLAFEDFIVKDEFTNEAEFEVIEKILNKAPARQVASTLEKMLDISIPVPRDYEHRSAEEYEAYKKSISYQLKNKIIPLMLLGIVGLLVLIGLFNFGKNCIYKPLKANKLYKQGYVLLQETEYPLSEVKFNEATEYRLDKKWFYKYARGYREHKQYQRAGKMYNNILTCFKHDKAAGLEYADMELNDLANYERAEEIVRREVLDYHINDPEGLLMLGDIFLEWATEKDPSKFEMARQQYATLIELNGATDLYLSRMMRYFIRTDNLREVLQLKQNFEPREKSLCGDDWTELSGYLLDKYYGELAPSEEYLRYEIEGLRGLLLRAVKLGPDNPIALYNLGRYFIKTNEYEFIEPTLQDSIEKFNAAEKMKSRDIYKYIDAYRLLGEHYITKDNFLQAQEQFAEGISLYITERDNAGFKGNADIGKLYEDMGDIKYSISGDYDDALLNYTQSVNLGNDSPKIRYRMGYVNYNKKNYEEALNSFMKAGDGFIKERNLLLAMANTLSLRGDDYAAEGYYEQLMESLDNDIANEGLLIPQAKGDDYDLVSTYLYGSNNYGVTLYRLAKKTGDSSKNGQAIVQLSESLRAWDALTRNPDTMIRLAGSNLAEQNIKYITNPTPEFEPEIYTNISKTLLDIEKL